MTHFIKNVALLYANPPIFMCAFDANKYNDSLFSIFDITFPPNLDRAKKKRKAEFLAGRIAARAMLCSAGASTTSVGIRSNRSPIWPNNIVGSISHTSEHAFCSISKIENHTTIGIDAENFLAPEMSEEIANFVVNEKELLLIAATPISFPRALTLAFSAKESLFKALNPVVGLFFDFNDAEITKIDLLDGLFELRLLCDLSTTWHAGCVIKGSFRFLEFGVLTQITIPSRNNS